MLWLLNDHWDKQHRSYAMSVEQRELAPLKLRSHGVTLGWMRYDERYTPYVREAGLLPFIQLVRRSTPPNNAAALTALIDHWRPETHTFHLRAGEMTVMLQDIAMITGLPIDGNPLCMNTDSDGWRAQMHALIGMVPPEPREPEAEDKKMERVAAGATFTWISSNFSTCPEDANEDMVKTYARVYMWYMISRTMFADGTGKNAPWMWLKALTVFDSKWSWGSATLAYLYRQLDEACCRHTGGIAGCLLALSIWSWECLPVGRPKTVKYEDWDDKDDALRLPTWAYKWDVLNETTNDPSVMYKLYKSELDAITPEQVEWEPYGKGESFGNPMEFRLNPMCTRDRDLWHMRCPLICNWAVELHLPHRVFCQFGLFQPHPPEWEDTNKLLHALDRKKQRKIQDSAKHHSKYVVQFALSVKQARAGKRAQLREHCPIAFNNYLTWFPTSTRVERAQIKKAADETETILETTPAGKSDGEGALRAFIKRQGQKLRRLSNLFGCRDPEYVSPERSRSATPSDPASGQGHGEPFEDEDVGVVTQEVADDMTVATYQARSAYELKPRKGINKGVGPEWQWPIRPNGRWALTVTGCGRWAPAAPDQARPSSTDGRRRRATTGAAARPAEWRTAAEDGGGRARGRWRRLRPETAQQRRRPGGSRDSGRGVAWPEQQGQRWGSGRSWQWTARTGIRAVRRQWWPWASDGRRAAAWS
ncbi:serine/threonine-protein phosphatase 7 long form homolog [Aegilops tauschii subsp. strangulata]|uniref:serine/threonine-protein phosphatase 7 long form homolog n=1 Tax=Aegilops tauschii subsp. strangulata TaxID=200361 RepID=UPI003CC88BCA